MGSEIKKWIVAGCALLLFPMGGIAQERRVLSLEQALELALANHQQLKISRATVRAHEAQEEIAKMQRVPTAALSANAFYLSDATVRNPDFTKLQTIDMPHFGNSYGLQASQLLFKGGVIKKSIEMAELQTQLSELSLETDRQAVKFLVISNYLDISKIRNQLKVYEQNKELAVQRLANIQRQYEQGMVTRNEVIRGELQIRNLEQAILTANNNHAVLSNQLSYALGLPSNILILPTESIEKPVVYDLGYYRDQAIEIHPAVLSAKQNIGIANKNVSIIKTDRLPAISAFGGYTTQRPLTTATPVMDLYNNTWQAGVSLSFNIDNLFKAKKRIAQGERQAIVAQEALVLTQQHIDTGINAAYLNYQESLQQEKLMEESKRLANENYQIVEAKYLNQLAIAAEMTDATNAKLEAELQHINAALTVQFQYYNLLKNAGTL